ncbi:MAG: hypothetical protein JHC33_05320 [Ignisphaera sp.]|nr:hypothetical protein [Ignisphaera sp.]
MKIHTIDVTHTSKTTILHSSVHTLNMEYLSEDYRSPEDFLVQTMGYKHEDFLASGEDEEVLQSSKSYWI